MSDSSLVQYEVSGGVATVSINRPDAMNSFVQDVMFALTDALRTASSDNYVRFVILTGVGRAFSAGADLSAGFPADITL